MKHVFLTLSSVLFYCIMSAQSPSFQLVSSSGDSFSNSNYQLNWSIGELQTESFTSSELSLTQGFHQGNFTITAVNQVEGLQFDITAYPNPASDFIILKVENFEIENLNFCITNMQGEKLQVEKMSSNNQQINFSNYKVGTYFITLNRNNQFIKSFQIIKY